ncbi:hypothetical protein ACHAXR_005835 [Thalassiosira sp. AJA248-18]
MTNQDCGLEPIYLLYDERMLEHRPIGWYEPQKFPDSREECDIDYPIENPERLKVIYERLCSLEKRLLGDDEGNESWPSKMNITGGVVYKRIACKMASKENILLAHSESQFDRLNTIELYSEAKLMDMSGVNDMYYCHDSFKAARLAAGGLLACVDAICSSKNSSLGCHPSNVNKAAALVRPPGHHACQSQEMGFCFIDSVVVAAKYALKNHLAKRIVILDFDIHDGNATAEATINDENIFRIDLHRYNPKHPFYPFTGPPKDVGTGKANGLNLNLAWSQGGMGNTEYAAAFYELVLPLLAYYKPDLLIISCGLDAAMGDLLGDCNLTPGFYHAMMRATIEVVGPNTPVLCALEGGYTISVLPDCMEAVTLAMLNVPFAHHSSQVFIPSYYLSTGACAAHHCCPWSYQNALERSRVVLSKYYVRRGKSPSLAVRSAVQDINNSIRIFSALRRWKHLSLTRIKAFPTLPQEVSSLGEGGHKRNYSSLLDNPRKVRPFTRPRIYLWYGTEAHHKITGYYSLGGGHYYGKADFILISRKSK